MFEVKIPKFDVNDSNVTIAEIYVQEGAFVNKQDRLFKAESTKMVRDITAEQEGYVRLCCKAFDSRKTGEAAAVIYDTREEYEKACAEAAAEATVCEVNATSKAIELAKKLGVDIAEVARGKNGIVKTADVEAFAERKKSSALEVNRLESVPTAINVYDRERVMIIGAGRMSEQIIDILMDDRDKYIAGVVDSYKTEYQSYNLPLFTCNVYDFCKNIDRGLYDTVIISFGGDKNAMKFRRELYELYKSEGVKFTNAIGDNVNIRRAVRIGENNVIMHNVFIGTGTQIGNDNIISYGTCFGHHNVIGSHNLFAPAFITPGSVKVGDRNIIMTGVKTINYISIGNDTVIPVGYNVTQDIADNTNLLK